MILNVAIAQDITEMQILRNAVTENVLSDPSLITREAYDTYLTKRGKGWVCKMDDELLGFCIADLQDNNIWALFVKNGHEKKGIGRMLHEEMLCWYFENTGKTVWLSTAPGTRAEAFYRRAGWKATGMYGKGEIKFEMSLLNWHHIQSQHR